MIILTLLAIFIAFWVLPNYIIKKIEEKEDKEFKIWEEGFREGFKEAKEREIFEEGYEEGYKAAKKANK